MLRELVYRTGKFTSWWHLNVNKANSSFPDSWDRQNGSSKFLCVDTASIWEASFLELGRLGQLRSQIRGSWSWRATEQALPFVVMNTANDRSVHIHTN